MTGAIERSDSGEWRISIDAINQGLPGMLLDSLERRWLNDLIPAALRLAPLRGSVDLHSQVGMLRVFEVPRSEETGRSLHFSNMLNVISSLRDGSHSMIYGLSSRREGQSGANVVKLLVGVRRFLPETFYETDEYARILHRSLRSNFPGIQLSPGSGRRRGEDDLFIRPEEYQADIIQRIRTAPYLSCITGIPSLREEAVEGGSFAQSVDRLVDALSGEDYLLLFIAEPILDRRLVEMTARLRTLSQEVGSLVRQSISLSKTQNESEGTSEGSSLALSIGAGQVLSAIFGISGTVTRQSSVSREVSHGSGASVTRESLDKTAMFCEQVLDHFISRMQAGRGMGFWNVGMYLASSDFHTQARAQGILRSLYSGENTHFEPLRVTDLRSAPSGVRRAITNLQIPTLEVVGEGGQDPIGQEYQSLATPMTAQELALLTSFPRREVPGLKIRQVTDFALNPPAVEGANLGKLLYRGDDTEQNVAVPIESLTRHVFITGLTGSGKTNTCMALLENGNHFSGLNFLVIDPAKTEYRMLLASDQLREPPLIFTVNDEMGSPFRLNPFEFVPGFPLLTHIDMLKAVFNASFPMYASMPFLLEEALIEIYEERGWNIATSTNKYIEVDQREVNYSAYLPRLRDLYEKIDQVVARKQYDIRLTMDITAALKARLGSLLRGGKGWMLDTQRSISITRLLERPVVLELQNLGDQDEKSFMMALLFILLYEAAWRRPVGTPIQHVTLIEEAHRLLRNVPAQASSSESANPRGKAIEMFTDMMAEMRARGEGFIIVDQMPGKLVPDVIKGSNLKIVHRLLAHDDRQAVGNAMGLSPAQIDHLTRLTVGQAVIHSEQLEEACLVKIHPVEDTFPGLQDCANWAEKQSWLDRAVQEKKNAFLRESPQFYYRYPGCAGGPGLPPCDQPCSYLTRRGALDAPILQSGWEAVSALILSGYAAVAQSCQKLVDAIRMEYGTDLTPAAANCIFQELADQSVLRLAKAHGGGANWQAVLGLQASLAALWAEAWNGCALSSDVMRKANRFAIQGMIRRPRVERYGCGSCPARCWLGHRFDQEGKEFMSILSETLRRGGAIDPQQVIDMARKVLSIPLRGNMLVPAGYCFLVHVTDNPNILLSYRQATAKGKSTI